MNFDSVYHNYATQRSSHCGNLYQELNMLENGHLNVLLWAQMNV